jgi:uncharacterized protein (TIGR04551 family)
MRTFTWATVALLALQSSTAWAQSPDGSPTEAAPAAAPRTFEQYSASNPAGAPPPAPRLSRSQLVDTGSQYPRVEWHGYFRFRADSFWNLSLGTGGTSPHLPPIEALLAPGTESSFSDFEIPTTGRNEAGDTVDLPQFFNENARHIGGANIRMRLRPIFHVTERAKIHLEMNILDNLVMGSTPDGFNEFDLSRGVRVDTPLLGFTRTQEPPNFFNAGRSSISVTQAYGEVRPFFGVIRLGRMASHWGLGMIANGGGAYSTLNEPRASQAARQVSMQGHGCMDCDFGDYVDRAMFLTKAFNHYITLGWDYNASGPTDIRPDEYFGQPRELSQYDDVRSYLLSIFRRPLSEEDIQQRNEALRVERRTVVDYGLYASYRTQRLSSEGFNMFNAADLGDPFAASSTGFIARGARALIPDLWFRVQSEPRFRRRIRLEGEVAGILGSIDNAQLRPDSGYDVVRERQIRQFGGAFEFDYVDNALATGVNAGFATGRTVEPDPNEGAVVGFGVIDQFSFNNRETSLTNFQFDRNYFVDMLMFREIIGTITNAVYVNPFVQYDLFARDQSSLGVRWDVILGNAMRAETTPSGRSFYGVETDLGFYYREARFLADVTGGLYVPGSAFNGETGRPRLDRVARLLGEAPVYTEQVRATPAWTVQGRFMWAF